MPSSSDEMLRHIGSHNLTVQSKCCEIKELHIPYNLTPCLAFSAYKGAVYQAYTKEMRSDHKNSNKIVKYIVRSGKISIR